MLVSTRQERIYVLDSINCSLKHVLTGGSGSAFENKLGLDLEASFTPDGRFILSGSQDGSLCAWDADSGKPVAELKGHSSSSAVVQMNPRYLMMASGCISLAFWIPIADWGK
jgi:COMPASS component SWD2